MTLCLPDERDARHGAQAGRWRVWRGWLLADAQARQLLGLPRRRVPVDQGWPLLGESRLPHWRAALGNTASPLHLVLPGPAGPVLMRGSAAAGGWRGLVLPLPAEPGGRLRARDEFVASLGHELRTPLNAILGFARLAQADGLPAAHLAPIDQAAQLMLRVVNDLLDLAQLEAGRLDIDADQPLDLPRLLARVAQLAAPLRTDGAVRLSTRVDPQCPAALRGDGQRIEQVLVNLVGNAMKFTDRGEVVLGVRVRARQADQVTLRLSVSDTGVGIPMEQLQHLGRPFERSLDGRGGAGLGLAVVRRLLELHGTQLRVASVPGGGTIMWFDLTLALGLPGDAQAVRTEPAPDPLQPDPQLQGRHFLVVDDNPLNLQVLQQMLARMGAHSLGAATAAEAVRLVGLHRFDAALLDVELGADNGLDLASRLRQAPAAADLPVVIVTAHLTPQLRLQAQAVGARACLAKPYEPAELRAALRGLPGHVAAAAQPAAVEPAPLSLQALFSAAWPSHRQALVSAPDAEALRHAVHALRGSLAFMPDPAARRLARELEEQLLAGQAPAPALLQALLDAAGQLARG